jgi:hypothetical protein
MGVCSIRFELNKNNAGGQDNQTTIIGCAFNISQKIRNDQSFIRSATAPETIDIAVATKTT